MNMHDNGTAIGGLPQSVERRIETEKRGMEYAAFLSQSGSEAGESTDCTVRGDRNASDDSYSHMNSLPFTHKNMVDLIHAYKAALWIEDFFLTATNMTPDIPLLQSLRHLDDLLCDLSPVFDKDQDYEEQPFSHILENKHLTMEEKAALLMGANFTDSTDISNKPCSTKDTDPTSTTFGRTSDDQATSISFTVADMTNLLRAYIAFKDLKLLLSLVGGIDPMNGILIWFGHMEKLLKDLSPLFSKDSKQGNEDFAAIIEDTSLDLSFKARILLGSQSDLELYKNSSLLSDMDVKNETDIENMAKHDTELSVPFTVDNMVDLLTAIYAYESLDEVLEMFTGSYLENDIIYGLCHLKEILYNISPRYNGEIDDAATDFYNTLKTLNLGLRDKARWMMGNNL